MGILRSDRVSGLGGANAINGSVKFASDAGAGQGTYLEVSDPDGDIKFGTSDWTIEFWMNASTIDTSAQENDLATILDFGYGIGSGASTAGAWFAVHQDDATLRLGFNNANQVQSSSFLTANTWHHIAITRTSNTAKIYGDGTQVATVSCSQDFTDATWRFLDIGSQPANGTERNFDGHISNLRIVKGTAIYTSAFTPPTTRLEKTSDTVLLCCQSPGNVFKEETGKSIAIGTVSKTPGPTASRFSPDIGEDHGTTFGESTRFNTLSYMVPPAGTTTQRGRDRGVMMGGMEYPTAESNIIEYIRISSGGITKDFGDLTQARGTAGGASSSTRGVMMAGLSGSTRRNTMDYITIATTGNALDFGDYIEDLGYIAGLSNQTRGVSAGGNGPSSPSNTNQIGYITIATTGNASDFGDLTSASAAGSGSASPTRGLFAIGYTPSYVNTIEYITIATTSNALDFGDLTRTNIAAGASCASQTRALFAGGYNNTPAPATEVNNIDYVTIASTGNSTDFGDLTIASMYFYGTSNGTRGVFAGRMTTAPYTGDPRIDSVIIASTGNAVNWGEMHRLDSGPDDGQPIKRRAGSFVSDSHGGLS